MLGFTDRLRDIIQGLRVHELRLSIRFRRLLLIRVFFGTVHQLPERFSGGTDKLL
jgi:hypothetical protein